MQQRNKLRQGDGLSLVLFSLVMNDLPQYLREDHCPGLMLGSHSLNCLMYADDLLVLSPSPERLKQSINVCPSTHSKARRGMQTQGDTKDTNIIIFSGSGQTKNKENAKYGSETLSIEHIRR